MNITQVTKLQPALHFDDRYHLVLSTSLALNRSGGALGGSSSSVCYTIKLHGYSPPRNIPSFSIIYPSYRNSYSLCTNVGYANYHNVQVATV